MNKTIIYGRITRDIEIKEAGKTVVANIDVAVPRNKEVTDFFPVVVFGKSAEYLGKYAKKGTPVIVEGRLQTRKYKTKDGQKRTAIEIISDNLTITQFPDNADAPADDDDEVSL